ncbi:hypothetical protein E2C01_012470 [Portunus trituberculatus]|uniref:Uncharacterized protein n=1 Tax=Portunus trituberculatus TaxID=210409 RepID=A0A5B7DE60_PORTR|nr:hypothetical protein [Portunus trituberculatus]
MWQDPRTADVHSHVKMPQAQQQQQCGTRQLEEDVELTQVTMKQLPFLQKLTTQTKIKILPHGKLSVDVLVDLRCSLCSSFP